MDIFIEYFIKYLAAYKARGINVSAVTLQNEPLHSADSAWTMYMDASYQAILAPKLAASAPNFLFFPVQSLQPLRRVFG
jgi:O-glycosyl hydrolase